MGIGGREGRGGEEREVRVVVLFHTVSTNDMGEGSSAVSAWCTFHQCYIFPQFVESSLSSNK